MATSVVSPVTRSAERAEPHSYLKKDSGFALCLVTGLTLAALAIHGYHPFAEDGGLYLAGVKRVLNPTLYPYGSEFVQGHLRFSLFAPAVAAAVKWSGIGLETALLLIYLASVWMTLLAGWLLACRCFPSRKERAGSVSLLAVWLTLPIAGTSLMLMDPYLTARSISTPCTLLALVGALDFVLSVQERDRWQWSALALAVGAMAVAGAMHPLMAAYGFGCVLTVGATIPERLESRIAAIGGLCATAVMVVLVLQTVAQPESAAYYNVAMSRYYWFLNQWHWYELVGLAAPLAILAAVMGRSRRSGDRARAALAQMGLVVGTIAVIVAAIFAREGAATHLVARLQPLRVFQQVYVVMILFVGAALAGWMERKWLRWGATFGLLAVVMFIAERQTFPASAHLEFHEAENTNGWVQAFRWIKANTPVNAVFAMDADYITRPGEDAQGFRAIAERSALPDYSKDGGEAAITPSLTAAWTAGQTAQSNLSERTDAERMAALIPAGARWVILQRGAATSFACDYANAEVKVCRLPSSDSADGVRLSFRNQPALQQPPAQATR